jgi:hypothetical protein
MSSSPSPSTASSSPGLPRRSEAEAGRLRSNTRSNYKTAWLVAVLWNLISVPTLFIVLGEIARNPFAGFFLLFHVVGVAFLVRAVRLTLRWRRFGASWFEMAPIPASPGGVCGGRILTRLERPRGGERLAVTVTLVCLRREMSGSGKNRGIRETTLWEEKHDVPSDRMAFTPVGTAIPVHIPLPADALESRANERTEGVFWFLLVEASLPGVDLHEDFEIPVHRAASTTTTEPPRLP